MATSAEPTAVRITIERAQRGPGALTSTSGTAQPMSAPKASIHMRSHRSHWLPLDVPALSGATRSGTTPSVRTPKDPLDRSATAMSGLAPVPASEPGATPNRVTEIHRWCVGPRVGEVEWRPQGTTIAPRAPAHGEPVAALPGTARVGVADHHGWAHRTRGGERWN